MKHEIKLEPPEFKRVASGHKNNVLVDNDPGYQMGDEIQLREWDPTPVSPTDKSIPKGFTDSPPLEFKVGYVQVLDSSRVILSLLAIKKAKG